MAGQVPYLSAYDALIGILGWEGVTPRFPRVTQACLQGWVLFSRRARPRKSRGRMNGYLSPALPRLLISPCWHTQMAESDYFLLQVPQTLVLKESD